jgi:PAS domain S-box-containing protein
MFDSANYTLTLPVLPPLIVGMLIAALGAAVLLRERASLVSVAFSLVTTSAAIWLLGIAAVFATVNESLVRQWINVEHLGVVFIPSLITVFTLAVMERLRARQALAWGSLALSGLFYAAVLKTDWFISGSYQYPWGSYPKYGPLGLPFLLFFFGTMLANLRLYWVESRRAVPGARRERLKELLLAFSIGYLGAVDFLPTYGITFYPCGYLPVLGFVGLMARAIGRYRLTDITLAFAAKHILKSMVDPLFVLDHTGHVRIVNQAACRLFGKHESELVGSTIAAIGRPLFKPELLEKLVRHDLVHEHEMTLPAERDGIEALSLTASVMRNQAGEPLATVCILRDITQRRRDEQHMRRSERQLAEAQHLAHLGSWELDLQTKTLTWSTELHRIYGLSPEEFSATYDAFIERVHPDDRESVRRSVDKAHQDRDPFTFYHRIVRPDGEVRILHARGHVVTDEVGQPVRMLGTGQDVTDLKRAEETLRHTEEQLRQAQRLETMGKFAGTIAHEFNRLLTVITRNSVYLMGGLGKQEHLRTTLEELKLAADQAAKLTQHLLAFSSSQTLKPKLLDLNAIVTGLRGVVQWLVGKEIELIIKLDAGLGWVKADPAQIELIISSLVAHARDAMPQGGQLTIKTLNVKLDEAVTTPQGSVPAGDYALLEVRDTGGGMDEEELAHVFEPFFAARGGGWESGLGLASVYGAIKQSDGSILVSSVPGQGTSLKVYLPLAK